MSKGLTYSKPSNSDWSMLPMTWLMGKEQFISEIQIWVLVKLSMSNWIERNTKNEKENRMGKTYSSSGVSCTGSPVNSIGKLAKSRSESRRGLNGGETCLRSSCMRLKLACVWWCVYWDRERECMCVCAQDIYAKIVKIIWL